MRELAGLHDRAGALEAVGAKPLDQFAHVEPLPRRDRLEGRAHKAARRHALQYGVDRRQNHRRLFARADHELAEARDTPRHDLGVRAGPVIGHRIPGRNGDDFHIRREEREARFELIQAPVIARDVQMQARRVATSCRLCDVGDDARVEALRHAAKYRPLALHASRHVSPSIR